MVVFTMKEKHYTEISKIIKAQYDTYLSDDGFLKKEVAEIVNNLADYFSKENTKFDRKRFLVECGLE